MNPDYLLHAVRFDDEGHVFKDVALDAVSTPPDSGFLWINLDAGSAEARAWAQGFDLLPQTAIDALFAVETRPRAMMVDGAALLNLRGVNLNPDSHPEDMVSIRIWMSERLIVSTRFRPLLAIDDLLGGYESGGGPLASGEFVAMLGQRLTQRMEGVIVELAEEIDALEEAVLDRAGPTRRTPLLELRRKAIILRRYIAPQREAINRLLLDAPAGLTHLAQVMLREAGDGVTRYVEELDAVRERATLVQEQIMEARADLMNRQMMVLSIVAAIFLPLGFLTGLFGINVGGMPLVSSRLGFWAVAAGCLIIAAGLIVWFKRKGWL